MSKLEYTLKIENPCSENWIKMVTSSSGKFCSSCSKNVTDFTCLTDAQVLEIISKTEGKICGRLRPDQLDRILTLRRSQKVGTRLYAFLSGLLLIGNSVELNSQNNIEVLSPKTETGLDQNYTTGLVSENINFLDSTKICGSIVDNENQILIGVSIRIKNTDLGTVADDQGKFELVISRKVYPDNVVLVISYLGYETVEIKLDQFEKREVKISMALDPQVFGEVVVVGNIKSQHYYKKWWQFWK